MKKLFKLLFSRIVIVSLLILLQIFVIFLVAIRFTEYFVYYYLAALLLALVLTLRIVNRRDAVEYKIAWLCTVLLFPLFGAFLYLIFSGNRLTKRSKKKMATITEAMGQSLERNDALTEALAAENPSAASQSRYISDYALCPLYQNTEVRYFPLGEDMFPVLIEELEKAEKYIFLEYFIIGEGRMWNTIHEILKRKAACGVDVRLIYDDMGCIMLLPVNYDKTLRAEGIRCHVFNRFIPILSARLNNRDHRKIGVVDGRVAFTGGVNFADEYINEKERFGHWKDNSLMLRGDAAWSMTVMFLTMWDYLDGIRGSRDFYAAYRPAPERVAAAHGWVQPYTDNPLDDEAVGERIYLNMINRAERYIWITTPYLVIDGQLESALCNAAKCGVDVRIVTPGIADKFIVYEATKSYYEHLIRNGVKIYQYTPGFMHAKTFLCDDRYATVGTVNLDFRSLYLHFECGVWMCDTNVIAPIRDDFEAIFQKCQFITLADCVKGFWRDLFRAVMALIAPLM